MKRRLEAIAVPVLLFCSCGEDASKGVGRAEGTGTKEKPYHVLTWEDYDGWHDKPEQARYYFDGKLMGTGKAGIEKLWHLPLGKGTRVRIVEPWERGPCGPDYMPPYVGTYLMMHWESLGVEIEVQETRIW